MVLDYQQPSRERDFEHFLDYAVFVHHAMIDQAIGEATRLRDADYSIHFHVFLPQDVVRIAEWIHGHVTPVHLAEGPALSPAARRVPRAPAKGCPVMIRRACLAAAASALLAVTAAAVPASAQAPLAGTDWPQFRGTPTLTGVTSATLPATLKVKWTFEAGDAVESSAAIAGGVAYVGSQKGELLALDLATGKPRWRYKTVEGIGESSPAVSTALGLVFVGDLSGTVHAVRVANGQAAWTFKTKGEVKSSPVVVGDKVVIGSYDGSLYGLDAKSGTQAWSVHTENYVHGTPAIVDGVAYFAGCDEVFRAIRVSDGKDLGDLPVGAYTGASVAVANGRAYFGTFENEVLAVDLKARRRWSGATSRRSGSSRSTRRRRSPAAR